MKERSLEGREPLAAQDRSHGSILESLRIEKAQNEDMKNIFQDCYYSYQEITTFSNYDLF